ncbi:Hypothetical predicted protein [Podarcis lilfordi]|uniref:Uncharacterized protein n=1 Tax=Podarcis lilfordi TaxID=74358 RepID=A0AA35PQ09_9SAUR|nr:Hypothetical predicted protein [Podarcis lilfordi]
MQARWKWCSQSSCTSKQSIPAPLDVAEPVGILLEGFSHEELQVQLASVLAGLKSWKKWVLIPTVCTNDLPANFAIALVTSRGIMCPGEGLQQWVPVRDSWIGEVTAAIFLEVKGTGVEGRVRTTAQEPPGHPALQGNPGAVPPLAGAQEQGSAEAQPESEGEETNSARRMWVFCYGTLHALPG